MAARRNLLLGALAVAVLAAGTLPGAATPLHANATPRPPMLGGCPVFPADNAWNKNISKLPVRSDSARLVRSISTTGGRTTLHPDFGGQGAYGIPFVLVDAQQKKWPIHYTAYGDESSPGPFPIPSNAPVEGGSNSSGDRHVIVVQRGACRLYELYRAFWRGNRWDAASGVNWNLKSNARRTLGWTSADAAGLPILPGLVRYGEVQSGAIRHALRFTVEATQRGYIFPATHYASDSNNRSLPAMGLRLRLKASYSLSRFSGASLVILKALKQYGMIVADNGSSWFITGAADPRWNDENLEQLKTVPGSAFEAVNTGPVHH
jgi:hypothetical protein